MILVGQHCMPTVGEFAFGPDAQYIRIDQAHEDIGRNLPIDLGIVSCELAALEALADAVPRLTHDAGSPRSRRRASASRIRTPSTTRSASSYTDAVHPAVIAKELGDFLYRGTAAEGTDHRRVRRLRHRALRAPRAARLTVPDRS